MTFKDRHQRTVKFKFNSEDKLTFKYDTGEEIIEIREPPRRTSKEAAQDGKFHIIDLRGVLIDDKGTVKKKSIRIEHSEEEDMRRVMALWKKREGRWVIGDQMSKNYEQASSEVNDLPRSTLPGCPVLFRRLILILRPLADLPFLLLSVICPLISFPVLTLL